MKKENMNNKGFSLVELIIVIAIMAILIVVLAPQYLKYVEKSRVSSDQTTVVEFVNAMQVIAADPDVKLTDGDDYSLTYDSSTKKIKVGGDLATILQNEGMLDNEAITNSKLQSTAYQDANMNLKLVYEVPTGSSSTNKMWFVKKVSGNVEPSGQLATTP